MSRSFNNAFGAMMLVAGTTGAALAESEATFQLIKVEAGARLFETECRRCHAIDVQHESYGPPLEKIVGRQAGTYPDYEYSEALGGSGIVWTPAALRAWMEDNDGFMPGTKMRHVGIEDRTVQDFILAYLDSISPQ
jgi:cytochrome c